MIKIGETLAAHRKRKGLSQVEAAKELTKAGITTNNKSIYTWEKDIATPNPTQFLMLCKIYGITDIYSTFIEPNPDNPLAILNSIGKEKALDYINILGQLDEYRISETAVINANSVIAHKGSNNNTGSVLEFPVKQRELPIYLLPASAGTGEFLDGEEYEMVVVGSEVPEKASFGIRLNGNSMEPRYMNGQIVWVYRTAELFDGDIGIFYLDGQAYCKKLHKKKDSIELLSFNPDYSPIKVTESSEFKIFGRVIS
ncbi:MAG: XRE family transcriptional regulator [Eubacterium sp.]|nr:XRE family transcriptional regulator [Eubacterium sp.]